MPVQLIYLSAGMLIIGVAPLPYGYYTLLRFVACGVFAAAAWTSYRRGKRMLPCVYGGFALLFNPLVKVHLPKEVWIGVDIVSAILLVATSRFVGNPRV